MTSIEQIEKSYAGNRAFRLQVPRLHIADGEIVALLGESGCGKTTLLRLIAGLEQPSAGSIAIAGKVVAQGGKSALPPEKRGVGMVFQDYALFPHLTAAKNIGYGLVRNDGSRIQEMLTLVGLEGMGERYPHQLSGGQQQRVAIARALANKPALLLLDEPFSNLDESLKNQVRNDLRTILKKAQATAIFVTHDTKDALAMADRIVLMRQGRVVQEGTPKELYERPASQYVANYFGQVNWFGGTLQSGIFNGELFSCEGVKGQDGAGWLGIRPAHVAFLKSGMVSLEGDLRSCNFMGDWQLADVALAGGNSVLAVLPSKEALAARLSLGFIPSDAFWCHDEH